ncbi:2-succinyl-5-enolpyruvyl-6-hydroxy-3-cyclohexene-1-carboxylic-acid synthase [Leucobacter sp. W1478]|uniref:2-succinyl-5-enolpyruvyl-6-hydroxy-3- cyclohexene-1-carboxylic-acid synthase n=1 Tax=Leucobacter sp. W1478 TaxID=3439065 RepID=UPI003F3AB22D
MTQVSPSSAFAVGLLAELIRGGVQHVVICPGSRSQALALAAAEAESFGAIRLHVRLDERSAGFFALGIARETGVPAPVIVTSGTAVANLMPAALEAHEGRVPMLLITADRPAELRGVRSNQTTKQAGFFGPFARLSLDVRAPGPSDLGSSEPDLDPVGIAREALAAAIGMHGKPPAGPVQLNLAFREPLSGWHSGATFNFGEGPVTSSELFAELAARRSVHPAEAGAPGSRFIPEGSVLPGSEASPVTDDRWGLPAELAVTEPEAYIHTDDALTVVIAGDGAGPEAEEFARAAGLPLLAEVVSSVRFGREVIASYATLIDDLQVGALIERAIVFGHPTLTRQIPALLRRHDVEVVVVDPHRGEGVEYYDPSGDARVVGSARVADSYAPSSMRRWLGAWVIADRALREQRSNGYATSPATSRGADYKQLAALARAEVAALRGPVTREALVEGVWRATWPHDRLMLAASRLVRVLDGRATSRNIRVHANRGLAGIDGTIATALGIASASQQDERPGHAAGVTRVLIGDLAFLHDAGSLLLPENEQHPRVQVIVGNDGGGTIFDTLEAASTAPREAFDRVMYTPQHVDLERLATAYGWEYVRVKTRGDLDALFTRPVTGPTVVEVALAR